LRNDARAVGSSRGRPTGGCRVQKKRGVVKLVGLFTVAESSDDWVEGFVLPEDYRRDATVVHGVEAEAGALELWIETDGTVLVDAPAARLGETRTNQLPGGWLIKRIYVREHGRLRRAFANVSRLSGFAPGGSSISGFGGSGVFGRCMYTSATVAAAATAVDPASMY